VSGLPAILVQAGRTGEKLTAARGGRRQLDLLGLSSIPAGNRFIRAI